MNNYIYIYNFALCIYVNYVATAWKGLRSNFCSKWQCFSTWNSELGLEGSWQAPTGLRNARCCLVLSGSARSRIQTAFPKIERSDDWTALRTKWKTFCFCCSVTPLRIARICETRFLRKKDTKLQKQSPNSHEPGWELGRAFSAKSKTGLLRNHI